MLSLRPMLPPASFMPQLISGYLSLPIRVLSDFALPLFAFTSTGISFEAVLREKSSSRVESSRL